MISHDVAPSGSETKNRTRGGRRRPFGAILHMAPLYHRVYRSFLSPPPAWLEKNVSRRRCFLRAEAAGGPRAISSSSLWPRAAMAPSRRPAWPGTASPAVGGGGYPSASARPCPSSTSATAAAVTESPTSRTLGAPTRCTSATGSTSPCARSANRQRLRSARSPRPPRRAPPPPRAPLQSA
jgi:hypothetical protein